MKNKIYIHTEDTHNTRAAEEVVPLLLDMFKIESVLDVGCGTGTWLKVFRDHGVKDYLGIDGSYVDINQLQIDVPHFKGLDLREEFNLNRKFDLALCLEVAEHLPETSAMKLVKSLVKHADHIIFSAAIPYQGGQNHLNEQWPAYWQQLFNQFDYQFYDILRLIIWNNKEVDWWYKQNMFYVTNKKHNAEHIQDSTNLHHYVHPDLFIRDKKKLTAILSGKIDISDAFKILVKSIIRR